MTLYVLLNWIFCISTSFFLIVVLLRYRFLFLKPSTVLIAFFHLQIQWAATIQAGYIENYLIHPFAFFVLAQVFPLLGLIGSFFIFHKSTIEIYSRLARKSLSSFRVEKEILVILIVIVIFLSIFYLRYIPPHKTGLYAIFLNPSGAAEAREASLKLVDNPFLRYSYSFLKNVFAPIISVLLIILAIQKIKINTSLSLLSLFLLAFIFVMVSLTGARYPAAILILTILWALYVKNGMPLRTFYLIFAFLLVLTPPVILTILREGQIPNLPNFFEYFKGGLLNRIFVMPMEVGLYHVYHAQAIGFFGIAAIPKLAILWGIQPINVANFIYLHYLRFSYTLPSGLANTSYVFSYYSYFGILSVIFSIFALWALDLAVFIFKRIKNNWLLLACVSSTFTASIAFVATDFSIALVTNGFLLILFTTWLLDRVNTLAAKTQIQQKFV